MTSALTAIAVALATGAAFATQARDLVVFAEPTLAPTLEALGKASHGQGGTGLRVFTSQTELALAQAGRYISCDLVVGLVGPAFDRAEKDETIDADTKTPFATNTLVQVAQGYSGRRARVDDAVAAFVAGGRLAIGNPDRDPAGRYRLEALRQAGLAIDALARSIALAESCAGVISFLGERRADIGIVYAI
jgi:ABC-type molybdate transport system substrate-binding protein